MSAPEISRHGGWTIHSFTDLPSTNTTALDWLRAALRSGEPAERVAFVAARQHAGRGQHGRAWNSAPGGLYLSAIVAGGAAHAALMPLHAGAAVAATLEALCGLDAALRWPNDIVLRDRKLGGVLCESAALGGRMGIVIGIGLNLSQDPGALPPTAITLAELGAEIPERITLAAEIVQRLNPLPPPLVIMAAVRERDCLFGRTLTLRVGEERITGTAEGIADDGRLLLRTAGLTRPIISGSISTIDGRPIRSAD